MPENQSPEPSTPTQVRLVRDALCWRLQQAFGLEPAVLEEKLVGLTDDLEMILLAANSVVPGITPGVGLLPPFPFPGFPGQGAPEFNLLGAPGAPSPAPAAQPEPPRPVQPVAARAMIRSTFVPLGVHVMPPAGYDVGPAVSPAPYTAFTRALGRTLDTILGRAHTVQAQMKFDAGVQGAYEDLKKLRAQLEAELDEAFLPTVCLALNPSFGNLYISGVRTFVGPGQYLIHRVTAGGTDMNRIESMDAATWSISDGHVPPSDEVRMRSRDLAEGMARMQDDLTNEERARDEGFYRVEWGAANRDMPVTLIIQPTKAAKDPFVMALYGTRDVSLASAEVVRGYAGVEMVEIRR